ncbi:MAG TPA: radical SAM protein [Acidithiobacillus sp.]|nr:radical SAM protein [Acidithiobacillus sp.]
MGTMQPINLHLADRPRRSGWVEYINKTGYVPQPEEVLFTTAPRNIYADEGYDGDIPCITEDGRLDWFAHHPLAYPEEYQPSVKSRSYDVAFLSANVPGPTYLELPMQAEIEAALASGQFQVLAISAHTWTIPWALKLAESARQEYGIQEVWLGGYGVMTPASRIREVFDRLYWGYAETTFREALGMLPVEPAEIEHPLLINESIYLAHKIKIGHLFWERGCAQKCTFCADPVFQPGGEPPFSVANVRKVLERYKEEGVVSVHLANQDVRPFKKVGKQIIELLHEFGLPFTMMTSFQALTAKGLDGMKWLADRGLTMAQLGVESLDDTNLTRAHKTTNCTHIQDTVRQMVDLRIRLSATYIICFENDTPESIRRAKQLLGDLGPIYTYFSVLLPMPGTPQYYDMLKRNLITDWNFRKWTGGYLVWRHPVIQPDEARDLMREMDLAINTPQYNKRLQQEWTRIDRMRERLRHRERQGVVADMRARARVYYHPESHEELPTGSSGVKPGAALPSCDTSRGTPPCPTASRDSRRL